MTSWLGGLWHVACVFRLVARGFVACGLRPVACDVVACGLWLCDFVALWFSCFVACGCVTGLVACGLVTWRLCNLLALWFCGLWLVAVGWAVEWAVDCAVGWAGAWIQLDFHTRKFT